MQPVYSTSDSKQSSFNYISFKIIKSHVAQRYIFPSFGPMRPFLLVEVASLRQGKLND